LKYDSSRGLLFLLLLRQGGAAINKLPNSISNIRSHISANQVENNQDGAGYATVLTEISLYDVTNIDKNV